MFTGRLYNKLKNLNRKYGKVDSIDFHIRTPMAHDLSIGQSVAHNGIIKVDRLDK